MRVKPTILVSLAYVLLIAPPATGQDIRLIEAVAAQDAVSTRALLAAEVNVNAVRADGATALLWAAHWDNLDLAATLIDAGADVEAKANNGKTAVMIATERGAADGVVRALRAAAAALRACWASARSAAASARNAAAANLS